MKNILTYAIIIIVIFGLSACSEEKGRGVNAKESQEATNQRIENQLEEDVKKSDGKAPPEAEDLEPLAVEEIDSMSATS